MPRYSTYKSSRKSQQEVRARQEERQERSSWSKPTSCRMDPAGDSFQRISTHPILCLTSGIRDRQDLLVWKKRRPHFPFISCSQCSGSGSARIWIRISNDLSSRIRVRIRNYHQGSGLLETKCSEKETILDLIR